MWFIFRGESSTPRSASFLYVAPFDSKLPHEFFFSHVVVNRKSFDVESEEASRLRGTRQYVCLHPNVSRRQIGNSQTRKIGVDFAGLSTTVAADAGPTFGNLVDKKVAATWRATHRAPEFLGEMVPVAGGWGHPWWGLLFGWASLGRYRVASFAVEGTTG